MPGPLVYWNTLRHLRPLQFWERLRFRLSRPTPDIRPAPALRSSTGVWTPPVVRTSSMRSESAFELLGVTRDINTLGWDPPGVDKLWRYNLHYFNDLIATDASARLACHRALMTRWIRENPPARGTGWEP